MDEAIKASAIVEHASRCDGQLYPKIIANEPRHNVVINRDKGTEVSDTWTNLIMRNRSSFCDRNMAAKLVVLEKQAWKPIALERRLAASAMPVYQRSDNPQDASADCICCTSNTGDYRPERVSWLVDFRNSSLEMALALSTIPLKTPLITDQGWCEEKYRYLSE
ncbi:hypothetical protein M514_24951 [Trichuris suis]|uniref:Uncharacterized protein n=1 Tax=Trichuris suis TaxID=68888 RepID=A0A085N0B5_9BILA|nr:hypothetical protein M514_24951 [Trichuris suis]